jgi:signal transduction histidine kinase/CheY-like chemotaxis protein
VTIATGIPRWHDSTVAVRSKRVSTVLVSCLAWTSLLGALGLALGARREPAASLAAAAALAVLFCLLRRRPDTAPFLARACLAVLLASVAARAMVTGQTASPALWCLPALPLLAAHVLGAREVVVWSLRAAATIGALEIARRLCPIAAEQPVSPAATVFATSIALAVAAVAAGDVERQRAQQSAAAALREEMIQRLLSGLSEKNRELSAARDAALEAARAKGEFLATMSHEIRTPLNAVVAFSGLLLERPMLPEQEGVVGTIRSSATALLGIVNDILDFSKIEAGHLELEEAPFDPRDCAEDAVELFGPAAEAKGIDLACRWCAGLPSSLEGDAGRVRQILVNLLSNAVKFTPQDGRRAHRVELFLEVASRRGSEVELHGVVTDTGIGIDPARAGQIFEPFLQADASTTRKYGGTGLGLAICRRLAERMGGRVWVESEPHRGSAFHFTVRAPELAGPPSPKERLGRAAWLVTAREGLRRAAAMHLRAEGLDVMPFGDRGAAERAAAVSAPALVVADREMCTDALLRALSTHAVPPALVVLSGAVADRTDPMLRAQHHRLTAVQVQLPLRRAALAKAIARVLPEASEAPPRDSGPMSPAPSLRVLVAEDNPVNQQVARLLLERLGCHADFVGDGLEAVQSVRAQPYDVVLMDVRMPELDGMDATRRIRRDLPADRQPYIIAVTANATTDDHAACRAAGMDAFLPKPITSDSLRRALCAASPPAGPRPAALDERRLADLEELSSGDPGMFGSLVDDYLALAARAEEEIRQGVELRDARKLARAAHSLKGASAQMGAEALAATCGALEGAAVRGEIPAAALVQRLAQEVGAVRAAMEQRRSGWVTKAARAPACAASA